jgi:hypothetical protein
MRTHCRMSPPAIKYRFAPMCKHDSQSRMVRNSKTRLRSFENALSPRFGLSGSCFVKILIFVKVGNE